ncbi:MAG TPA: hypothetical protein VGC57_04325 [Cellulomonas sp.]
MSILRRPRVPADLVGGFLAGEARALQTSVREVLTGLERAAGQPVPVELVVEHGKGERLVLLCRNLVVGFVVDGHAPALSDQLEHAGRARLVVPGVLYPDGDLWRVWVGAVPAAGLPVGAETEEADRLPAPEAAVLGIPLRRVAPAED